MLRGDELMGDNLNTLNRLFGKAMQGDVRIDVSNYDGKMDLDAFMDWLKCVEYFFDLKEY